MLNKAIFFDRDGVLNKLVKRDGGYYSPLYFKNFQINDEAKSITNDLKKLNLLEFKKDAKDSRVRHIYLSEKGNKIYGEIFVNQKKRIYKAFLNSSAKEVLNFDLVLKRILDEKF